MWVVKLGGSLQSSSDLSGIISLLAAHGAGRLIIVPGGGKYAEAVREQQAALAFSDEMAHKLALRAMEIYGTCLLAMDQRLTATDNFKDLSPLDDNKVPVWFPYNMIVNQSDIEASWRVTSDSLSLWLARLLNIENVLIIKSILPGNRNYSAIGLSASGYLDNAFPQLLAGSGLKPRWCHHTQVEKFIDILNDNGSVDELELIY